MKYKIIADSSADLLSLDLVPFSSVPLKIITNNKEYTDDKDLVVSDMISDLKKYKGATKSSCPNTDEWYSAFEDAQNIFCVTITSNLSGSCNSARLAMEDYLQQHQDRNGFVIDTLSVGPESVLIIEKLAQLITKELRFEEIKEQITQYQKSTHLIFCLDSLRNLANNGRVSHAVAKIAGILGIRIIGKASLEGTLEITNKSRGKDKAYADIISNMIASGYDGGKVHIHHCQNIDAAQYVKEQLEKQFHNAEICIRETRALCSFYAEAGGLLIGFEGNNKY